MSHTATGEGKGSGLRLCGHILASFHDVMCWIGFSGLLLLTEHRTLGDLKQQEFMLSQFWRLEVQTQGFNRAMLPARLWVELLTCLFLVSGGSQQFLVHLAWQLHHFNLCLCHHVAFSSCLYDRLLARTPSYWIKGSLYSSTASSELMISAITCFQIRSHSGVPGVRISTAFLEDTVQFLTCLFPLQRTETQPRAT